jgi:diguanylate cyclase (GGDEF)-like protein
MVFGFLIDWVSSRYHQQVWAGVDRFCRDHSINLVTLVTGRPGSPFRWEQMRNQLLELLGSREFDGFLFMTATLGNHMAQDQLSILRQKVAPAPVVSLGEGLSGVPTVMVDNREGFQAVLDHLYGHHGVRRFAFAGGPPTNADARERHQLFFDFLKARGLETRESQILTGEFSSAWGYQATLRLLGGGRPAFEALVCANDDIAMGAMEALSERGFHVPEDVVVTGFDDVATAGPAALTTARQQLSEMGRAGADLLWRKVLGREVPAAMVTKTTLVVRQTCGCLSPGSRAAEVEPKSAYPCGFLELVRDRRQELLDELTAEGLSTDLALRLVEAFATGWSRGDTRPFLREFRMLMDGAGTVSPSDFHYPLSVLRRWALQATEPSARRSFTETAVHRARILVSEVLHIRATQRETHQFLLRDRLSDLNSRLQYSRSFEEQAAVLLDIFPQIGIGRFRMALYEDPTHPMASVRMVLSEQGLSPQGGVVHDPLTLFAPDYGPGPVPWSFVAEAIFDQNAPLGYFLLDPQGNPELLSVFDQLSERVGRGLETVRIIQNLEEQVSRRTSELQEALETLESHNRQLKELALRDELTGLYNRRGFVTLAEHLFKAQYRRNQEMTLFFGDLDGLKAINDTLGHDAGDQAIRAVGQSLLETFRMEDVVARLGGDEFVVLAPGCTETGAPALAERLHQVLTEAGRGQYSISLGWISIPPRSDRPLADWLRDADDALYREKEQKRARRTGAPQTR